MSEYSKGFIINSKRHYVLLDDQNTITFENQSWFNKSTDRICVTEGKECNENVNIIGNVNWTVIEVFYHIGNYFGDKSGMHFRKKSFYYDEQSYYNDNGEQIEYKKLPKEVRMTILGLPD